MGNQFGVENRTGAGGTLATETVINATADGYTLLFAGPTHHHQRVALQEICQRARPIIADRPGGARPEHHGGDAVAAGQNRERIHQLTQGQSGTDISFASSGVGASPRSLSRRIFQVFDQDRHGPCALSRLGGGLSRSDVGEVQVPFDNLGGPVLRMVRARYAARARRHLGRTLAAVARRARHRRDRAGLRMFVWYALFAPRSAPADIVTKLNAALKDAIADPKILARFKDDGGVPMVMTPGALAQFSPTTKRAGARWSMPPASPPK